ncbi:NAD(P)H-dependent glycerol-3-phosphate dehydrogenase [Campylobacter sp. MIT 99-7217]|uniref:NAD(P)H-dependent glycerol-3-phosphate dehydrogenase n=1 Tax=Campylobacter sp. MIT 99-7217 TaxID=535091 RepID=UPI00115A4AEA|nr:NAD(P)H-dependent glycerol-3-phosphate dehydrogenase [Campylobacter sp. MIT 99-7217]TQR34594.1 NAD(P)H-dependent glycerol-3-phosphate dehydrogenase [Campylobacter sp. MIT 99-7217]
MNQIAIIGAGKWGSALKDALSVKNSCLITSHSKHDVKDFVSIDEALKCEYLVFALSSQGLHSWLLKNFKNKGQKILLASKGIETSTCKFLDEIFLEFVRQDQICVLSGPSFAAEVAQKLPCALVVSGSDEVLCKEFASFFPDYIKAYVSDDVRGAEVCGAYKNVLAIASGISDGLKLGNNARASLIARGLVEMHRFGKVFGAKEETFLGLSGAGDLFLTASSTLSRNYRAGLLLAKGLDKEQIKAELKEVIEGIDTAFAIDKISKSRQIYTPIVAAVVGILNGQSVNLVVQNMLKQR